MESNLVTTKTTTSEIQQVFQQRALKKRQQMAVGKKLVYLFKKSQNEDELLKMIDECTDLEVSDLKGRNLLMISVQKNFLRLFNVLLEKGFPVDQKDKRNQQIVFYLVSKKRKPEKKMESRVLEFVWDIEIKNNQQETVLQKALRNGHTDLLLQLQKIYSNKKDGSLKFQGCVSKISKKSQMTLKERLIQARNQKENALEKREVPNLCIENKTIFDEEFPSLQNNTSKVKNRRFSEGDQNLQEKKERLIQSIQLMKEKINMVNRLNQQNKKPLCQSNLLDGIVPRLTEEIITQSNEIAKFQIKQDNFYESIYFNVRELIQNHFYHDIQITLTGSLVTRTHTQDSNINITVLLKSPLHKKSIQNDFVNEILKFQKKLKKNQIFERVKLAQKEFLSVVNLSLNDDFQGQKVEIIFKYFQKPNYISRDNQIIQFIQEYPYLKPLYFVFKKMLYEQGLNDPSQGGLKGICMIYMIVAFLKKLKQNRPEIFQGDLAIGEVYLNFLYFYSYTFNYRTHFIRVTDLEESFFFKQFMHKDKELVIVDSYQSNIILTKIFKKSACLKHLFKIAYFTLYKQCSCVNMTLKIDSIKLEISQEKADDITTIYDPQFEKIKFTYSDEDFNIQGKDTMTEILEDKKSISERPIQKNFLLNSIFNLALYNQYITYYLFFNLFYNNLILSSFTLTNIFCLSIFFYNNSIVYNNYFQIQAFSSSQSKTQEVSAFNLLSVSQTSDFVRCALFTSSCSPYIISTSYSKNRLSFNKKISMWPLSPLTNDYISSSLTQK